MNGEMHILERFPLALYVTDIHTGKFAFASQELANLLGRKPDEFGNLSADSIYSEPQQRGKWVRMLRDKGHAEMEAEFLVRSERVPVRDVARLVEDRYAYGLIEDLREIKREREKLQIYRGLLEDASFGFHELNDAGQIVDMNRTERRLLGLEGFKFAEQPRHVKVLLPDVDQETCAGRVRQKLDGGCGAAKAECRTFVNKSSGGTVPVSIDDFPLAIRTRPPYAGIITTVRDYRLGERLRDFLIHEGPRSPMLEQFEVSTLIKVRRSHLRRCLETYAPDWHKKGPSAEDLKHLSVAECAQLVFAFGNGSFLQELGRKLEGVIGETEGSLFPHEQIQYGNADEWVLNSGKPFEAIEMHSFSDALGQRSSEPVQVFKIPLVDWDDQEKRVGVIAFYWRVTQDSRLRKEILEYLGRLHAEVLNEIPFPVYRKNRELRFTYANRVYCNHVGKPAAEILGSSDRELFPAHYHKYEADDRDVVSRETPLYRVEDHIPPTLGGQGRPSRVFVVKTPISGITRAEGVQGIFWSPEDMERKLRAGTESPSLDGPGPRVVVSYASEDRQFVDGPDGIGKHLDSLGPGKGWWFDLDSIGQKVSAMVHSKLRKADVALLMISPDYLSSDRYARAVELIDINDRHRAGQLAVIPIFVKAVPTRGLASTSKSAWCNRITPSQIRHSVLGMEIAERHVFWAELCDRIQAKLEAKDGKASSWMEAGDSEADRGIGRPTGIQTASLTSRAKAGKKSKPAAKAKLKAKPRQGSEPKSKPDPNKRAST